MYVGTKNLADAVLRKTRKKRQMSVTPYILFFEEKEFFDYSYVFLVPAEKLLAPRVHMLHLAR